MVTALREFDVSQASSVATVNSRHRLKNESPMVLHARVITGAGGGPDKTILYSPRYLTSYGYDSTCLFLRPPADEGFQIIRERAESLAASLLEIDDRGPLDWRILPRTLDVCRRLNVAIWHAHDYKTNLLGLLLRKRWPMQLVTTVHGWVERTARTRLYHQIDRFTLPRFDKVVCVSPDLYHKCQCLGIPIEKLVLIENAIDTEQFRRALLPQEAKRSLGWPVERPMVFAAGRLSEEKGFHILIEAIAQLIAKGLDVGLAIAGNGSARDHLENIARRLNIVDRVSFLGFQANLIPYYEASDVFALSSLREGLPNVVLEAMAVETPIVATRVAGVPRLIDDGENGLLVDAGNVGRLAQVIERLLVDPALRARLAVNGRQVIETRYSFSARMQKVRDVYASIGVGPTTHDS